MVFQKADEVRGIQVKSWVAAPFLLPAIALALVEKTPLGGRDEFLRLAGVVHVIGFTTPGQGDAGGVMKIVVPQGIQAVAPLGRRANKLRMLRFILGDQVGLTGSAGSTNRLGNLGEDMHRRRVKDLLRG